MPTAWRTTFAVHDDHPVRATILRNATVNLILLESRELDESGRVRLSDHRADHLTRVLRVSPGDSVRVGVIDGPRGVAIVESTAGRPIELRCVLDEVPPPRPRVDVLLALPRPKVMRRLWAQIAALGVHRIMITNAERVERDYFDAHVLTAPCYEPLLLEGLQQARDTRRPLVSIHRRFRVLIEDDLDALAGPSLRLVAHPGAPAPITAAIAAAARERRGQRVLVAIGPEGGWNSFETDLLEAHGFLPASMGGRTLRTDTATVALLAIVHDALGPSD